MMFRKIQGGRLNLNSLLGSSDKREVAELSVRSASVAYRQAAKEGLQSLYANPEDAISEYKDKGFDLVQHIKDRKGEDYLWVKARAIDADVVNANGDYFSEEELLADYEDQQGNKMPAYKTFEGVPIYTNHENTDITKAKGQVVFAEWDPEEKCVFVVFYVDAKAYPDIARGIKVGYMTDVSMGCQVQSGECSKCGNVAHTEKDYCECLKKYKGKVHPKTKEKVYEKNFELKFIELSVVGDGAFDSCGIEFIYDKDELLDKAEELQRKAYSLYSQVMVASAVNHRQASVRTACDEYYRTLLNTVDVTVKLAQSAGTLVGGPIMAGDGANQNTTVSKILEFLGIDGRAGLQILDMLNLALNFLEVAVMNMFARKDNVDLTHVQKITKSMAELQACMQDMIDDGVDSGPGGGSGAPLNQGNLQQGQQPSQPGPNQAQPDYGAAGQGGVGRSMGPQAPNVQQQLFMPGVGGGAVAFASKRNKPLIWAGDEDAFVREVTASYKETEE